MARRHQLDLLPLLDVFMVVLFVFATIQEQRLGDNVRDVTQLEQQLAEADQALLDAKAREREQSSRRAALEDERAAELANAKGDAERLRGEVQVLRQAFVSHQEETRAELEKAGLPEQALENLEVLSRVLEKYSVFEVDLHGERGEGGEAINRCCYRTDPLLDEWRPCGLVPPAAEDRERWFDEGASGLADALRRTKGGNAMTLIRQDFDASYRVANRLAELLRSRLPDHHVYAEEGPGLRASCSE